MVSNAIHKTIKVMVLFFLSESKGWSKLKYGLVIEGEEGVVTGMRNFDRFDVQKMARSQGWESFPF